MDREQLQKYEEDFAKIQATTNVQSCKELVQDFKIREERVRLGSNISLLELQALQVRERAEK